MVASALLKLMVDWYIERGAVAVDTSSSFNEKRRGRMREEEEECCVIS